MKAVLFKQRGYLGDCIWDGRTFSKDPKLWVLKNSYTKFGELTKEEHTAVTLALVVGGKASICGDTFQFSVQFSVHGIKHLSFLYLAGPC